MYKTAVRHVAEAIVTVADVIPETPDTTTLVLHTDREQLEYEAGQFVTIDPHQFEDIERFVLFFQLLKGR